MEVFFKTAYQAAFFEISTMASNHDQLNLLNFPLKSRDVTRVTTADFGARHCNKLQEIARNCNKMK
jgi:hypothetical protein